MAYYRTGTVSINNASATVTGVGTAWVANARVGQQIQIGQNFTEEIIAVVSDTELTLGANYEGSNLSGQAYQIIPVRGDIGGLITRTDALLTSFETIAAGPGAGRFADGSAAAPALTFLADQDTGLFRKGANKIGIAVGGQEAGYFDSDRRLKGEMVTQSVTDTTSGRLVKVGDYGWGVLSANRTVDDFGAGSVIGPSGTYRSTANISAITNPPPGANYDNTVGVVLAGIGEGLGILHIEYDDSSAPPQAWIGGRNATADPITWMQLYSPSTILGTVSESGGVPTGAVIERGSNANGEYVRFADGTQICSHSVITSNSAGVGWIFPAAFQTAPKVFGNAASPSVRIITSDTLVSTSASINGYDTTPARVATTAMVVAIGRWF